jgi:NADPH-dependent ferric siderophore reductase
MHEGSGVTGIWHTACRMSARADIVDTPMATRDSLDDFIAAAADALALPIDPAWRPAIRAHLEITLKHAELVEAFDLPDDAEPAPIFRA